MERLSRKDTLMGTWYLGARESKDFHEVHEIMRADPVEADDVGKDAIISYLSAQGRWKLPAEALPIEGIWFDGGGIVKINEPKINWEAGGCKMGTFVRQLPFILDVLRDAPINPKYGNMIVISGFTRAYVISPATRDASLEVMERLLKGTESLRQELELDLQKMMNDAPHAASMRKCGCLSGKLYVECCGKFVESGHHKQLRKAMEDNR